MDKPVYVALGDSLTAGAGDGDNPGLPGALHEPVGWARRLWYLLESRRLIGERWDFTDLATGGAGLAEVMRQQLRPTVARLPDLITLAIGMNDITQERFDRKAWDDNYGRLLEFLCAQGSGWAPLVMTVTFPNVAPLLVADPRDEDQVALMAWRQGCITGSVYKHSAAYGAVVCDLATQMVPTRDMFSEDGVHPSPAGHLAWAHIAYETLTEGDL